jgi:hypothetical protein
MKKKIHFHSFVSDKNWSITWQYPMYLHRLLGLSLLSGFLVAFLRQRKASLQFILGAYQCPTFGCQYFATILTSEISGTLKT